MGKFEPFEEGTSFEDKVKCLPEEDLLEVWVESQALGGMLEMHVPGHDFMANSYEKTIVHELSLRATQKLARL